MTNTSLILCFIVALMILLSLAFIACNRAHYTKENLQNNNMEFDSIILAKKSSYELGDNNLRIESTLVANEYDIRSLNTCLVQESSEGNFCKVYLQVAGVKGNTDSRIINIYLNGNYVSQISLYGLLSSSLKEKGGKGLKFTFDITKILKQIYSENQEIKLEFDIKLVSTSGELIGINIESISIIQLNTL